MLQASIVGWPARPTTALSASGICAAATATTTTSASVASPPSRPSAITLWPWWLHNRAKPPPTCPRPSTTIFTELTFRNHTPELVTYQQNTHGPPSRQQHL